MKPNRSNFRNFFTAPEIPAHPSFFCEKKRGNDNKNNTHRRKIKLFGVRAELPSTRGSNIRQVSKLGS